MVASRVTPKLLSIVREKGEIAGRNRGNMVPALWQFAQGLQVESLEGGRKTGYVSAMGKPLVRSDLQVQTRYVTVSRRALCS